MSFSDFVNTIENARDSVNEPSPLGGGKARAKTLLSNVRVKYMVAFMDDPTDKAEVERIFTTSLRCENLLINPGDICVFKEESNFDREGRYTVAIKYGELPAVLEETDSDTDEQLGDFDV